VHALRRNQPRQARRRRVGQRHNTTVNRDIREGGTKNEGDGARMQAADKDEALRGRIEPAAHEKVSARTLPRINKPRDAIELWNG
jgi:hypothetical protein